jgi:hypothetical protein
MYLTWDDDEHQSFNTTSDHPRVPLARHLRVLTPHVYRFQSLKVSTAWYAALSQTLETLLSFNCSQLKRISASYHRPACWDFPEGCIPFLLHGVFVLREFKLENLAIDECMPPLRSVTHLTLSMDKDAGTLIDFAAMATAFADLNSLVWLRLEGSLLDNDDGYDPPITIPSLQHLEIHSADYPGLDTSMECFLLPALQTLEIHDAKESFKFISSASDDGMPRFPTVRELDLYQRPTYEWEIKIPLLPRDLAFNFPGLKSLTLFCDDKQKLVPQAEFIRGNVDCFPSLETLDLRTGPNDNDVLLSMLQERFANGRSILMCRFAFDWKRGVDEQMDDLERKIPPYYELDPCGPALRYIGNLVSSFAAPEFPFV